MALLPTAGAPVLASALRVTRRLSLITLLCAAVPAGAVTVHTPPPSEVPAGSITVEGQGDASALPDEAQLSMTAMDTDINLSAAEKKVDGIVRGYLAKTKAIGVAKDDISTAGYSVAPQYDYVKGKQEFRGYRVTRNIELTVHKLSRIGDYLEAATRAGITQVSAPVLLSSKAGAYRTQALTEAAKDARAQARTIAQALGVELGSVRSVSTVGAPTVRPIMMRAMAAPAASQSANERMGFTAGKIHFHASVQASFEIQH
ncbi:MAG TPA: SIMPL domain-containing protein [Nevskiaceae bacterium]|nr:SIMPL domain-containing protein [Nevskiaceae bacterium]